MRDILEYCIGGAKRSVSAGTEVLHEGGRTGHLYVLIEGRLEVVKGDAVVAAITEPGAVLGEMSVLLDTPHTATVRAAQDSTIYEIDDADPVPPTDLIERSEKLDGIERFAVDCDGRTAIEVDRNHLGKVRCVLRSRRDHEQVIGGSRSRVLQHSAFM